MCMTYQGIWQSLSGRDWGRRNHQVILQMCHSGH